MITVNFAKPRDKDSIPPLEINAEEFIAVKGFKALGNQLTHHKVKNIELKESLPYVEEDEKSVEEIEVNDQEELKGDDEDSQIKLNL